VTTTRLEILSAEGDLVTLGVDCSAGFYVRSLAHDLGERLGMGAHLTALRRTRTGEFGLERAIALDAAERDPQQAVASLIPPAAMLPHLPSVTLTTQEIGRIEHGQDTASPPSLVSSPFVRLLDERGDLVAIAKPTGSGALHPSVVLV
jgi:tRNA pseudouridine55 synthase